MGLQILIIIISTEQVKEIEIELLQSWWRWRSTTNTPARYTHFVKQMSIGCCWHYACTNFIKFIHFRKTAPQAHTHTDEWTNVHYCTLHALCVCNTACTGTHCLCMFNTSFVVHGYRTICTQTLLRVRIKKATLFAVFRGIFCIVRATVSCFVPISFSCIFFLQFVCESAMKNSGKLNFVNKYVCTSFECNDGEIL